MKHFNFHSMWIKCFAFVFILIVLPILVISYHAEKYNIKTMLEQKRLSDLKDLESLEISLSTYLSSIESLGHIIAADSSVQTSLTQLTKTGSSTPSSASACFSPYLENYLGVCDISFMDTNGIFLEETALNRNRLSWFFNKSLQKSLSPSLQNWTKSFSIEYLQDNSTKRVISMLQPCYHNNLLLGYIVIFIGTDTFNSFLAPFDDNAFILENSYVFSSKQKIPFYLNTTFPISSTIHFFSAFVLVS